MPAPLIPAALGGVTAAIKPLLPLIYTLLGFGAMGYGKEAIGLDEIITAKGRETKAMRKLAAKEKRAQKQARGILAAREQAYQVGESKQAERALDPNILSGLMLLLQAGGGGETEPFGGAPSDVAPQTSGTPFNDALGTGAGEMNLDVVSDAIASLTAPELSAARPSAVRQLYA